MNAQTWIPWIITIVMGGATIINTWALELFRLKAKRTPVTTPDNPKNRISKPSKIWRKFSVLLWCFNIALPIYQIFRLLRHPTSNSNVDALLIALSVGVFFFFIGLLMLQYWVTLLGNFVSDASKLASEAVGSTRDVIKEHLNITQSQGKIIDSLIKDVDELKRPGHGE